MKIDFNIELSDIDGKPIYEWVKPAFDGSPEEKGPVCTLGSIVKQIMLGGPADEKVDAAEKVRRFELAMAVSDAMKKNEVRDMDVEDVAFIKKRAGQILPTAIYGPIHLLLK
jgi:hypothetical protein